MQIFLHIFSSTPELSSYSREFGRYRGFQKQVQSGRYVKWLKCW